MEFEMSRRRILTVLYITSALCAFGVQAPAQPNAFESDWKNTPDRVWIAPEFWANPMEDWRVADGRLECIRGGGGRSVHVLTRQIGAAVGEMQTSVVVGLLDKGRQPANAGFLIGVTDEIDDYRARLLRGRGTFAGISSEGELVLANKRKTLVGLADRDAVELHVLVQQTSEFLATITLAARAPETHDLLGKVEGLFRRDPIQGNIALAHNHGLQGRVANRARYWFRDWKMSGDKLESHDKQTFGPILWAMHTLSNSRGDDGYVLKMTAQMPPLGKNCPRVFLQLQRDGEWTTIQHQPIESLSRTVTFRVTKWDASKDVPYRIRYQLIGKDRSIAEHFWEGTVRKDPIDRDLVVAGFTGNTDSGFPNVEVARNVAIQNPDVLFFSGDQIYESVGGFGIIRSPVEPAVLNYLRKWYLLGFAFRDLMRDRPTICLPDDHDVYQGNIWGNGGNSVPSMKEHPQGGYAQHVDFVNAVHRTQCSHHPDLFDATPIKQDMSVFYGDMVYGRVGFAIIGDRMFKSGPTNVADWPGRPDHQTDPKYDVGKLDKPGLQLLGERQEKFLEAWGQDWRGADMKCVLSATIFCNLANYHGGNQQFVFADLDSNGWPQSGRNRALDLMRKCFAFHYAGDQHLPSIVHHGVDEHGDAGFSFCVPSIAAGYPRSWRPDKEGRPVKNRENPNLANTGEYEDGFRNQMRVHAIGNPAVKNRSGRINTLHDKSSGHGIVRFHKKKSEITIECYRLQIDANNLKPTDQFPGWPKTIKMTNNYGRKPAAHLPTLKISGAEDPVVQVINEASNEVVYTLRIRGEEFQPKVFAEGSYAVKLTAPDGSTKTLKGLRAKVDNNEVLEVAL
ncbi:MAG: twin-arginine translocation pathway signal [Planctomycetaceae bacterium]|nr:twin-arginine translocation pathway signal [Planctomycetaceae bacterium]